MIIWKNKEGSIVDLGLHRKSFMLQLLRQRKEIVSLNIRTMVRNLKVSIFINIRLDVINIVIFVIMQGIVRNHLTRIDIERNIMPQFLQKKNNLNKRNKGVKPRTYIKENNTSWLQHSQVPSTTYQIPSGQIVEPPSI